jgi:DNA mismatch repair protein MutS2
MTSRNSSAIAGEHALRTLEFDAVRSLLERCMSSDLGRALLPSIVPLDDLNDIIHRQRQTSEAKALLQEESPPSLHQLVDPRPLLDQVAQQGRVLEPHDLLDVQFLLATARQVKRFFGRVAERYPLLAAVVQPMAIPDHLERLIAQVVDARGEVKDSASPQLQEIRHELRRTRERVKRLLEEHLSQHKEVVREPLITLRNQRYVIPLRPDYQRRLRGIVHDHSSSGATVFVEPLDVLEHNNRLVELETAEEVEVHRILRALTTAVWEERGGLRQIAEALGELDCILARGRLSQLLQAHEPQFSEDGRIELVRARHPLLVAAAQGGGREVVPATLSIDPATRTLVITGPNTGGKTVLLKTIGVLVLMAQAGLHIPADAGSKLALFHQVFADIGDEQSLAQSLSTFAGHMHHIVEFLRGADARTLVLLDELGAGTDPAEGAALGIAILEALYRRGARTFVTTHHHAIKVHAHLHPGMETAAMAFDAETLQPTFHVRLGHFGGSNALAISQRLGLPPEVLALAHRHLNADEHRLVEAADRLQEELRHLERLRQAAQRDRDAAARARQQYEAKLAEVDEERRQRMAQTAEALDRWLAQTRRQLDEALQRLRQPGDTSAVASARALLRQAEAELAAMTEAVSPAAPVVKAFRAGDEVWLPKWRVRGVVLKAPADGGVVEVQAGQLTLKVPMSQVEALREALPSEPTRPTPATSLRPDVARHIAPELNLIGWRVADALPSLEKYLDEAAAAGLHRVRIIHGKGSGRLRAAVHELLTSHPHVKAYMPCAPEEGGWGATAVEMDV